MKGSICDVCGDVESKVIFSCECDYKLCADCIKFAFEDGTGKNSSTCPLCQKPGTAVKMVEAVVGLVGVKAVENELRSTVEFDVSSRLEARKVKSAELVAISEDARRIFNEIMEDMLLRCPKCRVAFDDYTECNALKCDCGCRFCSICLKDCGADAHVHVRAEHGNLFDKAMFETSKKEREEKIVKQWLDRLAPEELKQLVKNHLEKAGVLVQQIDARTSQARIKSFLQEEKGSLQNAVRNDRLSLLSDPSSRIQRIARANISPRYLVPDNYRLKLVHQGGNIFRISLSERDEQDRWVSVPLDDSGNTDVSDGKRPLDDVVTNLVYSLRCAVVGIERKYCLYQTSAAEKESNRHGDTESDCISISFRPVDRNGDTESNEHTFHEDLVILGLNPNLRINLLCQHVERTEDSILISEPIKQIIGAGKSLPLLEDLQTAPPETIKELNYEQRLVAHPLCMKTAMEVAGPPGTGKTKTITELTRSILDCTSYGIIVLSERNGAIDAIAEKFANNCMVMREGKIRSISDVPLWINVLTCGSASVGKYTRMFTLDEKMK